jgi:predicted nucleic acid-binding protein
VKPVLIDTGAIVALLDRSERHHAACVETLERLTSPLVTCEAVIAESCYLMRRLPGAAEAVLENVAKRVFRIPLELAAAAPQVQRILRKYREQEIDLADACLIHLADEVRSGDILTLDSDFEVYRWGANRPFQRLLPTH